MTDIQRRLERLEQENRDLKGRLDALQPGKVMPLPPSPVKISSPPPAKIVLPTEDEYRLLLQIVLDRYPILKPRENLTEYAAQFRSAFIRLLHCGRRDKIDHQRGLSYWCDDASDWCRRHNVTPSWIGGAAFTAAAIAHADIGFVAEDWPHDTAFALQWGGGGFEAKDYWRRALSGTLLDPEPPRYRVPAAAPSRIVRGAV